jgi:isocitrate dehydrogenase (NAD+)
MTPGACIGNNYALFSQGMPHSGMNIAGKNIANPTSILLSSVMMLRYLGMPMFANKVSKAVAKTLQAGKVKTADIGGSNTTTDFTKEIITNLN